MEILKQFATRTSIVVEIFGFFWERKLWWLIPFAILLALLGVLFAIAQTGAVAPWMYPL